jgi:hypothetical protein
VPRENGGIVKCLTSHRSELSATCTSFFIEMRAQRAAHRPADTSSGAPEHVPEIAPPDDQFER